MARKEGFRKNDPYRTGMWHGPVIADDARQRILALPEVEDAAVDIVWDPPWNPRMISEEGKKDFGLWSSSFWLSVF